MWLLAVQMSEVQTRQKLTRGAENGSPRPWYATRAPLVWKHGGEERGPLCLWLDVRICACPGETQDKRRVEHTVRCPKWDGTSTPHTQVHPRSGSLSGFGVIVGYWLHCWPSGDADPEAITEQADTEIKPRITEKTRGQTSVAALRSRAGGRCLVEPVSKYSSTLCV